MKFSDRKTVALCCKIPTWDNCQYQIIFNAKYFKNLKTYNNFCNQREKEKGTTHILRIALHEFLHSHYFKTMEKHINFEEKLEFMYLSSPSLKDEIQEKISYYATFNNFELYADYWAKEICLSLNKNWQPNYNPFVTPKIQTSPQLRSFINTLQDPKQALEKFT